MIRNLIVLLSLLISTSVWSNTDEGIVASYIHTVNKNVDAHSIARRIVLYSTTYKVPLDWSVAVAQKESTFYTNAYYKGNFGVYQINRVHLVNVVDPYDLDYNIAKGNQLLGRPYKSWAARLVAYNGGSDPNYIASVTKFRLHFQRHYNAHNPKVRFDTT
jgi:soluble lytic murein transglycosylase-like protein